MKNVFIKYNPYKLETEIKINGKRLKDDSRLGEVSAKGDRLQEWVEGLPQILLEEENSNNFHILFHGTLPDFEDLRDVFDAEQKKAERENRKLSDRLTVTLEHKPAKGTSDKEGLIDALWKEIQQGPFDELKDAAINNAFRNAQSSDFDVCVTATMSAGKSTLINAMLTTKLMPTKQEACTAIITRIKDVSCEDIPFQAEAFNQRGQIKETYKQLTYADMERLNADTDVSEIRVTGNIPFVSSEEVSLVLIDTPGPTNARNKTHEEVFYNYLNQSAKPLLLFVMDMQYETTDNKNLLTKIAESMKVGGKQSKDRIIFVLNKADNLDSDQTVDRVRGYMKEFGIEQPNVFPVASLAALNIRQIQKGVSLIRQEMRDLNYAVDTLNDVSEDGSKSRLHLETYSILPPSVKERIAEQLSEAQKAEDAYAEALVHSGIPSLEAAIRQYVMKYAKTAKIRNIVETFTHKLDDAGYFEETKKELLSNIETDKEKAAQIVGQIERIKTKMDSTKEAIKFEGAVNDAVIDVTDKSKDIVAGIIQKYQDRISKKILENRDVKIPVEKAEKEMDLLEKFAKGLEPEFKAELDNLVRNTLVGTGNALLEAYRKKLVSLTEEMDVAGISDIHIDSLKLMEGSVTAGDLSLIDELVREEKIEVGEEFVENTNKKWYKPWTWFEEDGYKSPVYETRQYVTAGELRQTFLLPAQEILHKNGEEVRKYILKQCTNIWKRFEGEFKKLDGVLKRKLAELEECATAQTDTEKHIKESEQKLEWLNQIKDKVESILEI